MTIKMIIISIGKSLIFKRDHRSYKGLWVHENDPQRQAGWGLGTLRPNGSNDRHFARRRTRRWCWRTCGPSRPSTPRCARRWRRLPRNRKNPWTPSGTTWAVPWSWCSASSRLRMPRCPLTLVFRAFEEEIETVWCRRCCWTCFTKDGWWLQIVTETMVAINVDILA